MNGDFALSQSIRAEEELDNLLILLNARGEWVPAAPALRWIFEELARTPMEFGESREYLEHLDLHVRVAFVDPFRVKFAVNFPNR